VSTLVAIVCRVLSCQTKSMTFTLTDVGSQKSFKNGTECRKARQIYGSVKAYFFVDKTTPYLLEFLTLFTRVGHPKFQNKTMSRKARQFWQPNGKSIHLSMHMAFMHAIHTHAYLAMVYPQSKPRSCTQL
jgi:hypothetical protein